ncbi:MAG: flagellar motor protein MotD [Methylophilaceae bacterium]
MARKQKHEEHENHERWLVSYADFITLLFAVFVVLFAMSKLDITKATALAESLQAAFDYEPTIKKNPKPQSASVGLTAVTITPKNPQVSPADEERKAKQRESMKAVAKSVQEALETLVKEGKVQVTETIHGITIEINASVLFETAKADLQKDSVEVLSTVAKIVADNPYQVQVEGHTDNQPIRSYVFPSNWELSTARASSVVRLFETNGVVGERMVAVGYADKRSVDTNDTPEGRARNRRVVVMLLADTGANRTGEQGAGHLSPDVRSSIDVVSSAVAAIPTKH